MRRMAAMISFEIINYVMNTLVKTCKWVKAHSAIFLGVVSQRMAFHSNRLMPSNLWVSVSLIATGVGICQVKLSQQAGEAILAQEMTLWSGLQSINCCNALVEKGPYSSFPL